MSVHVFFLLFFVFCKLLRINILSTVTCVIELLIIVCSNAGWHRGVVVGCRTRDQEVAGSSIGRALRRQNSGQVSHTYVPLSPSSITWYRSKGGDALRLGR